MKERRNSLKNRLVREVSIGPVDKWLEQRAEWMVDAVGIQKHLGPKIVYADKLAGKVEKGVKVLSIGSGKGHELDEMDKLLPGSEIRGLDPGDFYTRPVKKRIDTLAHDVSYMPESVGAEKLHGVPDEALDGVTLFFVLHHIEQGNHEAVLNEIHRVFKKGGKLFVAEDLVNSEEERKTVEQVDRVLNLELDSEGPHNYRSIEEWKIFFEEFGFTLVEANEQKPDKVRHGFFVLEKQ